MSDDELTHYGVLGVKWGVRKDRNSPRMPTVSISPTDRSDKPILGYMSTDGSRQPGRKSDVKKHYKLMDKLEKKMFDATHQMGSEQLRNVGPEARKLTEKYKLPWEDYENWTEKMHNEFDNIMRPYIIKDMNSVLPDGLSAVFSDDGKFLIVSDDEGHKAFNTKKSIKHQEVDPSQIIRYKIVAKRNSNGVIEGYDFTEKIIGPASELRNSMKHSGMENSMKKPDFSGYASKAGLLCSDGRTILAHAFKGNHGGRVPLVWNHIHDEPDKVLGHAMVYDRPDGTYVEGFLNDTPNAVIAREQLAHGDYDSLSVYANKLVQRGADVVHGIIREVSLVLAGANPGARIDNVSIQHSDGIIEATETEAVIHTGLALTVSDNLTHADGDDMSDNDDKSDDRTVADVINSLGEDEQKAVSVLIDQAYQNGVEDARDGVDDDDEDEDEDDDKGDSVEHSDKQENSIMHNVFSSDKDQTDVIGDRPAALTHSQIATILKTARKSGHTLMSALEHHLEEFNILKHDGVAGEDYGIKNIDYLFPEHRLVQNQPELYSRQMDWVKEVIDGVKSVPWTRIKTLVADITAEEARAKGYVKGNLKKEEVIKLLRRKTDPTTIYKKQKLDRDDILDITDIDIVAWLKVEMRLMLNEEIARAILLGDGRAFDHDDKVDESNIRPIANDDPFYAHPILVDAGATPAEIEEAIIYGQNDYRGSGSPVMFTTRNMLTKLLLQKDGLQRRMYANVDELSSALLVRKIVPVEPMEEYAGLLAIIVNLNDYLVGTNKGGQITDFQQFDIDFNREKYLSETRISGALAKPKAALVLREKPGNEVTPASPSFDGGTNTITIVAQTGVIYSIDGLPVAPGEIVIGETTQVDAAPAEGYGFPAGVTTSWTFVYTP